MIPHHATLAGAIGIQAGLGRERIDLDLTTIPEDALTIAIRGDNGMGKSTLLNLALVPWREPPTLAGSIYDQFGPTGLRELIWSHAGAEYWSRIEYKQTGKTRTQKATLKTKDDTGQWVPVRLPDNTVSDGKSSTYDACLMHLLGAQDLYYLAAFRGQNCPKLAEYADPKGLMQALLALDEPATLAEQAKLVLREIKRHHAAIETQAATLDAQAERIIELDALLADDRGQAIRAQAKLDALEAAAQARAAMDRAMAGDLDRQAILTQRQAIQARINQAGQDTQAAVAHAERSLDDTRWRIQQEWQRNADAIHALQGDLTRAQQRVAAAEQALAQRDAIQAAQAHVEAIKAQIASAEQDAETQRRTLDDLRALAGQIQVLEAQQAHLAAEGKARVAQRDDLRRRAGFIATVPCQGAGIYQDCPALADAIAAQGQIAAAEAAIAARRVEWKAIDAKIHHLIIKTATLPDATATHQQTSALLSALRLKLDAVQITAAQAATLVLAEQHRADAQATVSDLAARLEAAKEAKASIDARLHGEISAAEAYLASVQATRAQTLQALHDELNAIPDPGTNQALEQARARLAAAEQSVEAAHDEIAYYAETRSRLQAERDQCQAALAQGRAIRARAARLQDEIAHWSLLVLGLRGVIDLSIEDAGPGIAALANRLLSEAYGPRFSVRIVTQREQQNGVVRECFDISVIDAESGIESSILHKSGGESVWLDKALTDAVGLYHQEAAGQHYECLFADESEDGLTQERKQQFYRMDRAALGLGRYQRKFFISHNPDAWALADHVIDLAEYRESASCH